ncbi:uncharacterized protein [Hoplias malabaricus]|uniref:uncharacterized protein n=1 Tax=Hoplias malabaricus TaxID=27720 RepID=UPI0034624533
MRNLFVLLMVLLCSLQLVSSSPEVSVPDCCTKYTPLKLPLKQVKSYSWTRSDCALPAIVFTTYKRKHFCVDPATVWVSSHVSAVDSRKKVVSNKAFSITTPAVDSRAHKASTEDIRTVTPAVDSHTHKASTEDIRTGTPAVDSHTHKASTEDIRTVTPAVDSHTQAASTEDIRTVTLAVDSHTQAASTEDIRTRMKVLSGLFLVMFVFYSVQIIYSGPAVRTDDCCEKYFNIVIPIKRLVSYFKTSSTCAMRAVVFYTTKGLSRCVNPELKWVKKRITILDSKHTASTGNISIKV